MSSNRLTLEFKVLVAMVPRTFRQNFACRDFFKSLTLGPAENLQIHWQIKSVCEKYCYSVIPVFGGNTINHPSETLRKRDFVSKFATLVNLYTV